MKKIVIMPGGFHPFHAGHMALYDAARETFPSADVFVAATADISNRPFPFTVKKFLAQQAGVPGNRFIQVKSPFRAEEIMQMYDPDDTQLIFVRSEKDRQKQPQAGGVKRDGSPAYLQPYKRNRLEPFSKHGYMAYLPTVQFGPGMTSATEIRAKWPEMEPEEKIDLVKMMYPSTTARDAAAGKIVTMLDEIIGVGVEEGLGRSLAGSVLAGALAMTPAAPAQAAPTSTTAGNTVATVIIDGQQKVYDLGSMDVKQAGKMLEKKLDDMDTGNWKLTVTDGKSRYTIDNIGGRVKENMGGAQASLMGAPVGGGSSTLNPTSMPMANDADRSRKGVRMGVEFDESVLDEGIREKLIAAGMAGIMAMGALAPQAAKAEVQKEPAKAAQAVKQSDLGKGVKRTDFKDGTYSIQDASGITVYDAAGKMVQKVSPRVAGFQQSQQADGSITQNLDRTDQDGLGMKLSRSHGQTSASINLAGQQLSNEATLINDPDAGVQIRPAGGMGTYDEATLVSNLARKFASMVDMVRNRNYGNLHHVLYRAGVVENMVRALAELEQFQKQQGRRPIARGREIDITDYVDEK